MCYLRTPRRFFTTLKSLANPDVSLIPAAAWSHAIYFLDSQADTVTTAATAISPKAYQYVNVHPPGHENYVKKWL